MDHSGPHERPAADPTRTGGDGEQPRLTVAVTGATGFAGSAVVRHLIARGDRVCAVVRDAARTALLPERVTPLIDPGTAASLGTAMRDMGVEAVLHLAARQDPGDDPDSTEALVAANIVFGARVLAAAHAAGARVFVSAGTFSAHGDGTPAYAPATFYAATKRSFQDLAAYYDGRTGMRCVTLELADTYGPNDVRRKFLNLLAEATTAGCSVAATAGEQSLHPIHVDDVATAFAAAVDLALAGGPLEPAYSVAGRETVTLRGLVDAFAAATGTSPHVEWGALPYRTSEIMAPYVGPALPGWEPAYDLARGLADAYGTRGELR